MSAIGIQIQNTGNEENAANLQTGDGERRRTVTISDIIGSSANPEEESDRKATLNRGGKYEKPINKSKRLIFWRLFLVTGIALSWVVVSVSLVIGSMQFFYKGTYNETINEKLLAKINITNETIICPDTYIFSKMVNTCQPVCGKWRSCGIVCFYLERVAYAILTIIGIIVGIFSIFTWIRLIFTWKFQHHPIFIGIVVNFFLSLSFSISDIPGIYYTQCGGVDIDYPTICNNPNLEIQIQGTLTHCLALSNRMWFIVALLHILYTIWHPLKEASPTKWRKMGIIFIEFGICFGIPLAMEVISFGIGARYTINHKTSAIVSNNEVLKAVFGYIPHAIISPVTITIVIITVYKTRTVVIKSGVSMKKAQNLLGIEKRLIAFSGIYFILTLIIATSISLILLTSDQVTAEMRDHAAMLTLRSTILEDGTHLHNMTVASLLSYSDQLRITETSAPVQIYLLGVNDRILFIMDFAVVNVNVFSLFKFKACGKKTNEASSIIISNPSNQSAQFNSSRKNSKIPE